MAVAAEIPTQVKPKRTMPPIDPVTKKFMKRGQAPVVDAAPVAEPEWAEVQDTYVDPLRITQPTSFKVAAQEAVAQSNNVHSAPRTPDVHEVSQSNPFRVWTAGPNMPREGIRNPANGKKIRPSSDGAYYLVTPQEVELMRRALGANFWTDDVPDGVPDARCDTCQWHCRSYRAMNKHLNDAHGHQQYSG